MYFWYYQYLSYSLSRYIIYIPGIFSINIFGIYLHTSWALVRHTVYCVLYFLYQFFITKNCDIQFCIHRALKNTTRVEAKRSCHGISGSARMAFQHSLHLMWYSVVFLLTSLVRWQSRQIPISLLLTLQVSQVSFKIGLIPWLSIREVGSTGFGSL